VFYMQEPEVRYASMAAQRRAAPVYWYEPKKFVTGLWVLSKWEHQRFVGSHPELFSNKYGAAIGDASEPATVMHQLPEWAQERIRKGIDSMTILDRLLDRFPDWEISGTATRWANPFLQGLGTLPLTFHP
jgi:hypothetical protein